MSVLQTEPDHTMADPMTDPTPPTAQIPQGYYPPPEHEQVSDGGHPFEGSTFSTAFEDRVGNYQFQHGSKEWGYVAQLHEWAAKEHKPFEWSVTRVGGQAHMPEFEAYPICVYIQTSPC